MKTTDVKHLVEEALNTLSKPYSEHVIDEVFSVIETTQKWRVEYEGLCGIHSKNTVNGLGGYWIGRKLGKRGKKQVPSQKSGLIGSYSLLDTDAKSPTSKPKEGEALQLMADYFKANKAVLPPVDEMKKYRPTILELLMDGLPPEDAFVLAIHGGHP